MELGKFTRGSGQQSAPTPGYPQVKIEHRSGRFMLNGFDLGRQISIIGLGLLRSRQYWEAESVDGTRSPVCQSHDAIVGIPRVDKFPWDDSEFSKVGSNLKLSCKMCSFKGWLPGEKQPRCKQTWTVPFISPDLAETYRHGSNPLDVMMVSFTASSILNLKPYLTPFRDNRIPLYSRVTDIILKRVSKGGNVWTEAHFATTGTTDDRMWPQYSALLHKAKDFMQPRDEGQGFTPLEFGSKWRNFQ